ncbi:MAG: hypothetical protein OXC91_00340 [Rhodobacteraceae bacterium]|nr:hypothetical protein [Paracoccaceae bacterium]MCY4258696.1 hypothetical protein [Paracoccaceae bacterium]
MDMKAGRIVALRRRMRPGRRMPDRAVCASLMVIDREPDAIASAPVPSLDAAGRKRPL